MLPEVGTDVLKAKDLLMQGECVVIPTETVYGLAADALNSKAVARVFEIKNRPNFNPLLLHVSDIVVAQQYAEFNDLAKKLARQFWPGPLTFVLPQLKESKIAQLATANLDTIAVRIPAHPLAHKLLKKIDRPLVAPSANPSGLVSPTTVEHVKESLGNKIAYILDGGPCKIGVESTIIDLSDPKKPMLLRPGGTAKEEIEAVMDMPLATTDDKAIKAPGQLKSHYALSLPLRLNVLRPDEDEAYLSFGHTSYPAYVMLNLSPSGNMVEAAANLFDYLRKLEAEAKLKGLKKIAVAAIPNEGLGLAINDRLTRAAAAK